LKNEPIFFNWGAFIFALNKGSEKMKYYLVAVLDKDSNRELDSIQKPLFRKGKKIMKSPYMGIPIDVIEDPDREKLQSILTDLLKPYRYFHVDLKGKYTFQNDEKITGIPVTNFGYIKKLQRHLNSFLQLSGFKVTPEKEDDSDFILSMSTEKLTKEFENSGPLFSTPENTRALRVERIELWKSLNAKKDSVVFSIPLKNPNII